MRHTIFWNGLKNMQLECYLQPIYDVQNNKINVAEALFRARQHNGTWFDTEQLIANLEATALRMSICGCWSRSAKTCGSWRLSGLSASM